MKCYVDAKKAYNLNVQVKCGQDKRTDSLIMNTTKGNVPRKLNCCRLLDGRISVISDSVVLHQPMSKNVKLKYQ